MYKVDSKLTIEMVEGFDRDDNIFYRWQNPEWTIEGEYLESWSMSAGSKDEAIENAREDIDMWDEEEAILPGKSCMPTLKEIMSCENAMFPDFVLMAFEGIDTGAEGHDGEYVAEFIKPLAIFDIDDAVKFYEENEEELY